MCQAFDAQVSIARPAIERVVNMLSILEGIASYTVDTTEDGEKYLLIAGHELTWTAVISGETGEWVMLRDGYDEVNRAATLEDLLTPASAPMVN